MVGIVNKLTHTKLKSIKLLLFMMLMVTMLIPTALATDVIQDIPPKTGEVNGEGTDAEGGGTITLITSESCALCTKADK